MLSQAIHDLRRIVFGRPISTQHLEESLLGKFLALPVLCCDAISSVAYGNQQILLVLCLAGLWQPHVEALYGQYTMWISYVIAFLLVVVAASYWQTVFAYPNGGGSYIVSRENLGEIYGLIAAAALLVDYVLVVAVSVASAMQNLKDIPCFAFLDIGNHLVGYSVAAIAFMTMANLRGLRESAILFVFPVYTFITMAFLMVFLGLVGPHFGWQLHPEYVNQSIPTDLIKTAVPVVGFSIAIFLRAFAAGCSALTGLEAVSNGVPAFKEPRSRNAALTIVNMAAILGSVFLGVSCLATHFHVVYWEHNGITSPAVIDQISGMVFGKTGQWSWAYVVMQISTGLILVIAAQTSFAGFPRLRSIMAVDRFMPRQLTNLGDKLAYDNGVMALGLISAFLIVWKNGSVDQLIPFFMIGVFVAFTLSQAGMVRHWFVTKGKGWIVKSIINGCGAFLTFIVFLDIAVEKFIEGAWIVIILMTILIFLFKKIYAHYTELGKELSLDNYHPPAAPMKNIVLVLVQGLHAGTMTTLDYARSISNDCRAVYVEIEPERTARLQEQWSKYVKDVPLVVIKSPYRSLVHPIIKYLHALSRKIPNSRVTVVIGEFISEKWWHTLLHGNTGLLLKLAFLGHPEVVVCNVRYWLKENQPADS